MSGSPYAGAGLPFGDAPDDRAALVARSGRGDNAAPLSVSALSAALKQAVESGFSHVRVRGEISGFKRAASGHFYMCLKDADATLDAVMWRTAAARIAFRAEDGLDVIATGRLTTYPGRSKYQLVVESLELAGEGALLALLEKNRQRFAAEGLFANARPLPTMPRVIGVVTSPTGSVIRDIIHRIEDRFPTRVLVWPVRVQGQGAAEEVAAAIRGFGAIPAGGAVPRPDLIIVARGGGSVEDLWGFNDEAVIRAVAAGTIPLISAVGHETDTTLIDHAADRRAPTPTAAAEMAVPVRAELAAGVADVAARLLRGWARLAGERRQRLSDCAHRIPSRDRLVAPQRQRLDEAGERFGAALVRLSGDARAQLDRIACTLRVDLLARRAGEARTRRDEAWDRLPSADRLFAPRRAALAAQSARLPGALDLAHARAAHALEGAGGALKLGLLEAPLARARAEADGLWRVARSLDPRALLAKGYAIVLDPQRHVVASAAAAKKLPHLTLQFADGEVAVRTDTVSPPTRPRGTGPTPPPRAGQGSLFD